MGGPQVASASPVPRVVDVWEGVGGADNVERIVITQRLDTPWRRLRAWLDLLIADHGVVRLIHRNWGIVGPGMFRSAQLAPHHLRRSIQRHAIKTVINLRAERNCGAFVLEEEVCAALGVELVNIRVRSRDVPSKEVIAALDALFDRIAYPALMHCKSGSDRTGIAGVLYLVLRQGWPMKKAMGQLSWRWGHVRAAKTGILDYVCARYIEDTEALPRPFREWVRDDYDPAALKASFMSRWRGRWFGLDLTFWRE